MDQVQHNVRFTDDEIAVLRSALMARIGHLASVRDNMDASADDRCDVDLMIAVSETLRERLALVLV